MPALAGSCSLKGNPGVPTVTNVDHQSSLEVEIGVRGARITDVRATVLTASDIRAHNIFEDPKAVEPATVPVAGTGTQLVLLVCSGFRDASGVRCRLNVRSG